ncbi:FliM/FliN family flagellar motor switch protein [Litoreibacter roseus]|uniref:Flagellar motor switch protein FliN n=1 Tax=Litoreibacter roseus TaxID=2601869 RepID=A0A6N6JE44_9RHOB|nr:FliM/FliN family flagellar motor C-terminal domain-containing protein [Litoreibacter roseus]GFE64395.1 hypothetical protein KIN_14690 [Litoreibacter roseus]
MPDQATGKDDVLQGVNVELKVSVGTARPTVKDLLSLQADAVLPLDKTLEDPVELFIGDRLIGRGHLEEAEGDVEGRLAVRITALGDPV